MIVNNCLSVLDMDEHLIPRFESIHKKGLEVCKEIGAILDLATSDTTMYLYADNIENAQKVADVYGTTAKLEMEAFMENLPNLQWFCIECKTYA